MARKFEAVGGILSYFTRHRTAANLLMIVMIVAGLVTFPKMRAQFFPDVVIESVTVSTSWPGASAEDVDAGIVQLLEPALLAVEGVESTTARSREGSASISLDFEPDWDMARATADVQSAVDAVRNLPADAEDPNVRQGAWRDRVTDVVITGPVGVDQLALLADELTVRLFAEGVTRTTIRGVAAPETIIEVNSLTLMRYDLTLGEIADAIGAEVNADPAGDVSNAQRVRTGTEKRSPEALASIVMGQETDGSQITLGDIALIEAGGVDRLAAFYVGDAPAMTLRVDRSDRGDAIDIQATVEEVVADMSLVLPQGVEIRLIRERADFISGRLELLLDNGLLGLAMVVALLFLFLNARTAFWVAAGIPVAMLTAISFMWLAGLTINMISLFALIITLGIVVDDAIVVGEHADFRHRNLGENPVVAAELAAKRMFTPVFSATLTTIIAFFGLVLIGGRFGSLIADIPFTVIVVLAASLIECFLILPNHMSHAVAASAKERWYDLPSRAVNRGFEWIRDTFFRPFIAAVIWARYPVTAMMVLLLSTQVADFVRGDVTWRFFSPPERGSITGNFAMAPQATREDSVEMMQELQRAVEDLAAEYEARHGANPVDFVMAQVGASAGRGLAGTDDKDIDQLGGISIELIDADLRPYSSFAFVAELQDRVVNHPLVETVSFRSWRSGPGGDALDIQLSGADADTLKAAAEALKTELAQFSEVSALQDSLAYGKEELILDLTPQGAALGFDIDGLGRILRHRLGGVEAATYPVGPRTATITVQLPEGELTADFLDRIQLRTPGGIYVPLADIVSVQRRTGFSTVERENGIQLITVSGDLDDEDAARAAEIMAAISETILPQIEENFQVATDLAGLSEQENEFLADAQLGLFLALTGIYLVLAWIFASWTRPLVVMAIIPFGLIGTIHGHEQWGVALSMFTVVGMIGMTGIIINDSIVLVTTIDEYAEDRGLVPAIIDGTTDRLRPVLLTTLTTVLGLAPLLYEGSSQAEFLKPTVITLVYGLSFGMFLVLLLVPSLIAMQMDVGRAMASLKRALQLPKGGRSTGVPAILGLLLATGGFATMVAPPLLGTPALLPLPELSAMTAFGLWIAGVFAVLVVLYLLAGLLNATLRFSRRRSP